ncbi:MAG: hypothetical protein ACJ72D_22945 [Marmoricola sp.]
MVVAALFTGLLTVAPGAGPAGATDLSVGWVEDTVVDGAHGRVFVSGGALATADLTGTPTGAVAGISAAKQMTLTPDGSQLVVANADGLAVVDAATATLVRTISTGPSSCPNAVATAAGKVFFTYGDCDGGTPGLGAVDLTDDAVTKNIATGAVVVQGSTGSTQSVVLKSVAAAPNTLALLAGTTLAVLDATGGVTPSVSVRVSKTANLSGASLAMSPDGTAVVAAVGTSTQRAFATSDLSTVRDYTSVGRSASSFRADGRLAVPGDDVVTFNPDGTKQATLEFFSSPWNVANRGLAYGSERLYAVLTNSSGGEPVSELVVAPVGPAATLSITTDHTKYDYRATATVTINLSSPTHSRTVSLSARTYGQASRWIKTAAVSSSTRTLTVKVSGLTRNTVFTAKFAGDDVYAPATASRSVNVRVKLVILTASTSSIDGYHRLHPSPYPSVTFQVYPSHPNQCLRISGFLLVHGTWRYLGWGTDGCVKTDSKSRLVERLVGFRKGDRVRILAKYSNNGNGDEPEPGWQGNVDSGDVEYRILMY